MNQRDVDNSRMQEEQAGLTESQESEADGGRKRRQKSYSWRFAIVLLLTVAFFVGLFFLWARVSYRMRFSTEFIRAGLTALYILPCLIGGRIIHAWKFPHPVVWAAALGGCVFGLVVLLALVQNHGSADWEQMNLALPVMCVLGAVVGSLSRRKRQTSKNNGIE